jgi:hypothetical protein
MSAHIIGLAGGLALIALLAAGKSDLEEAERHEAHRAEMVQQWCETNGRYGWPPTGAESCQH